MISDKQLEANRANAQHSTGPKTEAGKQRSSMNAYQHGFFSRHFVIDGEDPEWVDDMIQALADKYQPEGPDEELILERIVHGMVNRQRGEHLLQQCYFETVRGGGKSFLDLAPNAQRYIRESDRSVERAYELLFSIRAERRKENKEHPAPKIENGFVSGPNFFKKHKISSRPIPPLKVPKLG